MSLATRFLFRALFGASLLAGATVASALPAAAALDPTGPDLTMTLAESASQAASGGTLTYTLAIGNTPVYEVFCDYDRRGKPLCTREQVAGGPVSGVLVQDSLPAGATLVSAAGDHGFSCFQFGGVVTCSNGALDTTDRASITVAITAPSLPPGGPNTTLTNLAIVNPQQTINERDYSNNSATISATDLAPR